jgi:hypothetical protein
MHFACRLVTFAYGQINDYRPLRWYTASLLQDNIKISLMSRPGTPSAKTGGVRSHREDVLSFLDNLDSFEGSSKDGTSSPAASLSKPGTASGASAASRPSASSTSGVAAAPGDNADDPQAVLDFLDEIVANRDRRSVTPGNTASSAASSKKPAGTTATTSAISRSGSRTALRDGEPPSSTRSARDKDSTVPPRKSGDSARSTNMTAASHTSTAGQAAEKLQEAPVPQSSSASESTQAGGWGWGSVWSQASNVLQQARTVAEEVGR